MADSPFLHFGDLVVLWCEDEAHSEQATGPSAGFISRCGSLDVSLGIATADYDEAPRSGIRECVFRLCRPFAYSAKQEYDDYLLRLEGVDTSSFTKDELRKFSDKKEDLLEKVAKEKSLNEVETKKHFGEPVNFGDAIQLQHWISGDFIDVFLGTIADRETAAVKLALTENGSQCSELTITPVHKIRRVGHPVSADTDVVLKVRGTGNEHYFHATFSAPAGAAAAAAGGSNQPGTTTAAGICGEANCYFQPSSVRIRRFDGSWGASNHTLNVGAVLQVFHPDSGTSLCTFPARPGEDGGALLTAAPGEGKKSDVHPAPVVAAVASPRKTTKGKKKSKKGTATPKTGKAARKKMLPSVSASAGAAHSAQRETHGLAPVSRNVVRFSPLATPAVPPIMALWVLESESAVVGGLADWNLRFRLKHFETAEYLVYHINSPVVDGGRRPVCADPLGTVCDPTLGTLFTLRPATRSTNDSDDVVDLGQGVHLVPVEYVGENDSLTKQQRAKQRARLSAVLVEAAAPAVSKRRHGRDGGAGGESASPRMHITSARRGGASSSAARQRPGGSGSGGGGGSKMQMPSGADSPLQLRITTTSTTSDAFVIRPLALESLRPYDTCLELMARFKRHTAVVLRALQDDSTAAAAGGGGVGGVGADLDHAINAAGDALVLMHSFLYDDGGASVAATGMNLNDTESILTTVDDPRFNWPPEGLSDRRQLILCTTGHHVIMARQKALLGCMRRLRRAAQRGGGPGAGVLQGDKVHARRLAERLRRLCNMVYSLVTVMCQAGNAICGDILLEHVPLMASHTLDEVGAYDAMKEIVRDNPTTLINNPALGTHVDVLARNLANHGFDPDCLEFLEVLCTCDGIAITQNQAAIVTSVVQKGSPFLVHLCLHREQQDHRAPRIKADDDLFPCFRGQTLGPDLLERKHPILIGWSTNDTAHGHGDAGAIAMEDIFAPEKIIRTKPRRLRSKPSLMGFRDQDDRTAAGKFGGAAGSSLSSSSSGGTDAAEQAAQLPTKWVPLTYFVQEVVRAATTAANKAGRKRAEAEGGGGPNVGGGGPGLYDSGGSDHGDGDAGDGGDGLPVHEQVLTMYSFAITQLRLLARCAEERNYVGINVLNSEFSVELLVTGLHDARLPCELRECFANLLLVLYVDVAPHRRVNVPSRTYIVYGEGGSAHMDERSLTEALGVPEPYKFSVVQLVLLSIFNDLDEADNAELFTFIPSSTGTGGAAAKSKSLNAFVAAVLNLVQQLIALGFFSRTQTPSLLRTVLDQLEKFTTAEATLKVKKLQLMASRQKSQQAAAMLAPSSTGRGMGGQGGKPAQVHPLTSAGGGAGDSGLDDDGSLVVSNRDLRLSDSAGGTPRSASGSTISNAKLASRARACRHVTSLLLMVVSLLAAAALLGYGVYFRNHPNHFTHEVERDEVLYNTQLLFLAWFLLDYSRMLLEKERHGDNDWFGWRDGIQFVLLVLLALDTVHYLFFNMIPAGVIFYRCVRVVVYGFLVAYYALLMCGPQKDDSAGSEVSVFRAAELDSMQRGLADDGKRAEKLHLFDVLAAVVRFRQQDTVATIVREICNGEEHELGGSVIQDNHIGFLDDRCKQVISSSLNRANRDPDSMRIVQLCRGFLQWADAEVVAGAVKASDAVMVNAEFVLRCVQGCTVLTEPDAILTFKKLRDDFWAVCDLVEQCEIFTDAGVGTAQRELFFDKANSHVAGVTYAASLAGIEDLDARYLFEEVNKLRVEPTGAETQLSALVWHLYQMFAGLARASRIMASKFFNDVCDDDFVRCIGYSPGASFLLQTVVACNPKQHGLLPQQLVQLCALALDQHVQPNGELLVAVTTSPAAKDAAARQPFANWSVLELVREQHAAVHVFLTLQIDSDVTGAQQLEVLRSVCHSRNAERRRVVSRLAEPVDFAASMYDEVLEQHYNRSTKLGRGPTVDDPLPPGRGVWAAHLQCSIQSRLLYMLAFSCSGTSTLNVAKVSNMLPFTRVVKWIVSSRVHWNLKAACFVFLRYTAVDSLLGKDYIEAAHDLLRVGDTMLRYANDACQVSHTFDVLCQGGPALFRDDFMEFQPPVAHTALFVGNDLANTILFRITALHMLPLAHALCTQMGPTHKQQLRGVLRNLQGKVARLVDWTQRHGYDLQKQCPVLGTAGASVSGVSCFELFAFRVRELHDTLALRVGALATATPPRALVDRKSLDLDAGGPGSPHALSAADHKRPSPRQPRRPSGVGSRLRSPARKRRPSSFTGTGLRNSFAERADAAAHNRVRLELLAQQSAQLLAELDRSPLDTFDMMHEMARAEPARFGLALRHLMSVLEQCVTRDPDVIVSPGKHASQVKQQSAEHHSSLLAGGERTPRQVVVALLRGLLVPRGQPQVLHAESYDQVVGSSRSLDVVDEHTEQMRLQLLYVGALEVAMLLYGQYGNDPLGMAALKLAVQLLSRTPSQASKHQDIANRFFESDASAPFFARTISFVAGYTQRVRNEWLLSTFADGVTAADEEEVKFLLQLLRLCCLSRHSGNQQFMRERVARDGTSHKIMLALCSLFAALSQSCDQTIAEPHKCEKQLRLARQVAQTLEDMIVGPCMANQHFLAFQTSLLHVINQVFRNRVYFDDYGDVIRRFPDSCVADLADNDRMIGLIRELQTSCLTLMQAMLEGRPDTAVHSKICDTIELSVLMAPLARAHAKIMAAKRRVVGGNTYKRHHSPELMFGSSLMSLFMQLRQAQPEWWEKHLDDQALEHNLQADVYSEEEVAAFRFFCGKLLHVDVLWKIYDVGGGAGETISMPVAKGHLSPVQQAAYTRQAAKFEASQKPRYLRQRFYFVKPTIAFFTHTDVADLYLQDKLVRDTRETKLRSLLEHSAFLYARLKIQRAIFENTNGSRLFGTHMMEIFESVAFGTGLAINLLMVVALEHSSGAQGRNSVIVADVFQTYSLHLAAFFEHSSFAPTDNIITRMLDFLVVLSIISYFVAVVLRIINVALAYGLRAPHGRSGDDAFASPGDGAGDGDGHGDGNGNSADRDDGEDKAQGAADNRALGGEGGPPPMDLARAASKDKAKFNKSVERARYCWRVAKNSVVLTPTEEQSSVFLYLVLVGCGVAYLVGRRDPETGVSPVLMSLTLLQFFLRNSYIRLVLQAVTSTLQQLAYTLIGMIIIMYIFAVIAFRHFSTDFDDGQCLEMWSCLLEVLNFGMRNGGGIGDTLHVYNAYTQTFLWVGHSLFDWLFFVIINVIFLNVVFGIIVDQFAELRDQRKEKDADRANCCPICGEDIGESNDGHLKDHALSNYLYFFIHLDDESTVFNRVGVEAFICDALADDATVIDWFPRADGEDDDGQFDGGGAGGGGGGGSDDRDNGGSGGGRASSDGGASAEDHEASFDMEETMEQQRAAMAVLQQSVETLRMQNEAVTRTLARLQDSMSALTSQAAQQPEEAQ